MEAVSTVRGAINTLNGRLHEPALWLFTAAVVAHWAEHLVQAFQIFVLDWKRPASRGLLGQFFPWLIKSESLHYFFAIFMLVGLIVLLPAFQGRARFFWIAALAIQFWHHIEHALLLYQRATGDFFFNEAVPTSLLQNFVMRVELHLFYNAIVFIPMVIAVILHMYPPESENNSPTCTCTKSRGRMRMQPGMAEA